MLAFNQELEKISYDSGTCPSTHLWSGASYPEYHAACSTPVYIWQLLRQVSQSPSTQHTSLRQLPQPHHMIQYKDDYRVKSSDAQHQIIITGYNFLAQLLSCIYLSKSPLTICRFLGFALLMSGYVQACRVCMCDHGFCESCIALCQDLTGFSPAASLCQLRTINCASACGAFAHVSLRCFLFAPNSSNLITYSLVPAKGTSKT